MIWNKILIKQYKKYKRMNNLMKKSEFNYFNHKYINLEY